MVPRLNRVQSKLYPIALVPTSSLCTHWCWKGTSNPMILGHFLADVPLFRPTSLCSPLLMNYPSGGMKRPANSTWMTSKSSIES